MPESTLLDTEIDSADITLQQGRLLRLTYLCPIGLAGVDNRGTVLMLNALGTALLKPIDMGTGLDNLFDLLRPIAPELIELLEKSRATGEVCRDRWIVVQHSGVPVQLSFTVTRIDANALMIAFADITAIIAAEKRVREAIQAQAVLAGRAEAAATVLHDIGNAVTGIVTRSSQILADPAWPEVENLARLGTLLHSHAAQLEPIFGERKTTALVGLSAALERSLRQREITLREHVGSIVHSVAHVQEILSVQRRSVTHGGTGPRSKVSLGELIDDTLALHATSLEKRAVQVVRQIAGDLPALKLDRTRMIQVFGNIILNAAQSFDTLEKPITAHRVEILAANHDAGWVRLAFKDNGSGFPPEQTSKLFERGISTKPEGSGLGLTSCRSTVEAHGGHINIESQGVGKGATVTIDLPAD